MIYFRVFNTKNQIVYVSQSWQKVLDFIGEGLTRSDLCPNDNQRFFGEYRIVTCKATGDIYYKVHNLTKNLLLVTPNWESAIKCLNYCVSEYTNNIYEYITETEKSLIQIVYL